MKIDIKTMLLTIGVCILFAFSTGDILTIKPATPTQVMAVRCDSDDAAKYVLMYAAKGYIVKSFTSGAHYDYDGLLVMEKY